MNSIANFNWWAPINIEQSLFIKHCNEMKTYFEAMPHGQVEEVFPDVFFVMGTMRNEFFGSMWQFSRNMTVVRENGNLTIINSVRLNDEGLAKLDKLGKVVNVVRIGDAHGVDDPFYLDRYNASFWALPDMNVKGLRIDHELREGGPMPFSDASLFVFKTSKRPECIIHLDRAGGIMIACDSLQNWTQPDEFFDEPTVPTMTGFGFFTEANVGVAWMHECSPQGEDFTRLKEFSSAHPYKHAICGHGIPLRDRAMELYHQRFTTMFNV
jgi:hypothetical protein